MATSAVENTRCAPPPYTLEYLMELKPVAVTVSEGSSQVGSQLGGFNGLVEHFHGRHNVHLVVRQ